MDYSFNNYLDQEHKDAMMKRVFAVGCMIYTIMGFGFQYTNMSNFDPFWMRFLVSSLGVSVVILSQISDFFKRNFSMSLFITMLIYNAHFYYLLFMNDFDASYKTSLLVVIITTILFINRTSSYLYYSAINMALYIGLMAVSDHWDKQGLLLGFLILMVLIFGYLKNKETYNAFFKLKKSEEQINEVNNNVFYGIFRINTEGRLLYANDQLVRMLGYNLSEDRLVISELRNMLHSKKEIVAKMATKQSIHDEVVRYNRKDGSDFWGQLNLTAVVDADGDVEFFDGTLIDITDKKRAENELMLFSAAIDHTPTGVVITDRFGIITYANPYFTKLTGYTVDEVMGKGIEKFGAKDDPNSMIMWKKLVSGDVWKGDLNFRSKDGEVLTELTSVAPIWNEKGHIVNFVIISEDITERKKAEVALLKAKEEAEATTKAKEQFLSTMSHELRTPMNSVIGISNLLLDEHPRPEQAENLNILKYSATHLLAIINDILDLSKIEAGKLDFNEEDFDLHYTLINIKRTLGLTAKNKGLKLNLTVDKDLPNILRGDQLRLSQVLNNLVSNALKFTEKGQVNIDVKTLLDLPNSVELQINVSDTGIGIPEDQIDEIFESFSQANAGITRKYGGTGLGLAITKKLVEMQGGTITVTSRQNEGSTFSIRLKFKKGDKAFRAEKIQEIKEFSQLNNIRILLVDDNKINQKVAIKFLSRWNTVVEAADNGLDALQKITSQRFDIVLMDIQMPEMNGYEATRAIRRLPDPEKSNIPIIALTAAALSHEKENAFLSGMNDYVCKPFSPAELYSKLVKYTINPVQVKQ